MQTSAVTHHAAKPEATRLLAPFLVLLACYCAWIFTLPIFPSLDGSLHLYYASVLASLLGGSKTFTSYYFVRHILPPYALHYYFLIGAAHFFGYVLADKLLVCLIFITTACGFRYLATCLGPSGAVMSLWMIPLLLNWPLGMGFYNYCLSLGMALWGLGFWYRAVEQRSHRLWLAFLATVVLMVLTHPIPTLFIYVLVSLDVVLRVMKSLRAGRSSGKATYLWPTFRLDLLYALAMWATLFYLGLFIVASRAPGSTMRAYPVKLLSLLKLSTLAMFSGSQPAVLAYRLSLYFLLLLAVVFAAKSLRKRWRDLQTTPADLLLTCSIFLLIAIPFLPGSNYITQRLVIVAWIGALAAASGRAALSPNVQRVMVFCACAYAVAVLVFADARIRPVAAQIAQIETTPLSQGRWTGLVLGLPDAPDPSSLNYIPYYWAGTRYFRRTQSTLLNGGWLYEHYLPLGSNFDQLSEELTPEIQDSPGEAYQLLLHSQSARKAILPHASLLLFTGSIQPDELLAIVKELDQSEPSRTWVCESHGWYSACTSPFAHSTP